MMWCSGPVARCIFAAIAGPAVLGVAGIAGGCASQASSPAAATAEESVRIQVGQRVLVESGNLEIVFETVTTDSRCPKGETCVWEGDAIVALAVRSPDRSAVRLELHTSAKAPSAASYLDWSIRLAGLEPYPVTGQAIQPAEYVATLVVGHGPVVGLPTQ